MIEQILYGGIAREPRTLVSIQSVSLGGLTARYLQGLNYFEERNFYLLELLRNANWSCVVVLSEDIDRRFHEYAVATAARTCGLNADDLARRFRTLFVASDGRTSLCEALLRSPDALQSLRGLLQECPNPMLDFWAVSELEIELSKTLGVPHFGLTQDFLSVDSKSNGRAIFSALGIPLPKGAEGIFSMEQARDAMARTAARSDASAFLIKLNCEEAGNGIARIPRSSITLPLPDFIGALEVSKNIPVEAFVAQISEKGAVVEEFIEAPVMSFPSVKMSIAPDGQVMNLATHDQVLHGMAYAGSRFPAGDGYRHELIGYGHRIAAHLSAQGVRGIVSVDFMATRRSAEEAWSLWGLEINARKGATTHPYFWTRCLTGADYDEGLGELRCIAGAIRYRSSEYIQAEGLSEVSVSELVRAVQDAGLAYDPLARRGVLLHMATCLRRFSKFGATFIGSSDAETDELYAGTVQVAQRLAKRKRDLSKVSPPY